MTSASVQNKTLSTRGHGYTQTAWHKGIEMGPRRAAPPHNLDGETLGQELTATGLRCASTFLLDQPFLSQSYQVEAHKLTEKDVS